MASIFFITLIRVHWVMVHPNYGNVTQLLQYVVLILMTLSHDTGGIHCLVVCRMERSLRNCEATAESWGQRHSR